MARRSPHYASTLIGLAGIVLAGTAILAAAVLRLSQAPAARAESGAPQPDAPQYTADGKLLAPQDYREWIYLSSGLGMEYRPTGAPGSEFTNVFVKPSAYRAFLTSGRWPDKTVFVLEERASATKGSINLGGHYQTDLEGLAASVKDEKRFPEKWAYFSFDKGAQPARPNPRAACLECHNPHGAVDNTFVQFYPTLQPVARKYGTYSQTQAATDR
jgi:Cytochrome P460